MIKLIFVNLAFALLLAAFLLLPVTSNWAWLVMIALWCLAEGWIARDSSIRWWQWLLLFIVLGALDVGLVLLFR
ncbi:MAG: hypothetical protein ACR2PT_13325 [Endozoicomonas sp.]